jgi:peptide deformylase
MEGLTTFWEACASCLNNMGMVLRPYKVTISYMDLNGNKLSKVFEGFGSTVFCHE